MSERRHSVVTGGSGFIGTHLVRRLLAERERVSIVDLRRPRAELLDGGAIWVNADIRDPIALAEGFDSCDVSRVYHLAAMTGVRESADQIEEYRSVNVEGTRVVLDVAIAHDVECLLYTSSSSIYGPDAPLPTSEGQRPGPSSPYAATKLEGERVLCSSSEGSTMAVRIARLFTVYGPGARSTMAIPRFITGALEGNPVPIFGSLDARRDFTYVSDAVDGLIRLSRSPHQVPEVVNLATGLSHSLREVIEIVERETRCTLSLSHLPADRLDVPATHAELTRARQLGYSPAVDLATGICKTIEAELKERGERICQV